MTHAEPQRQISLSFDGGTLLLTSLQRNELPNIAGGSVWQWDMRVMAWRCDADGFTSHLPSPKEFDSSLEESLATKFGPKRDGWQLIREGEILHDRQKTFVPDFTFRHEDGTQVFLEIVGFWTPAYLARRRETLRRFRHHKILIAMPEKSVREGASIGESVLVYKTAIKLKPLMEALARIRAERVHGGSH
jgi:predicted nuclease of restriction endonuclease-like RecB superfamily